MAIKLLGTENRENVNGKHKPALSEEDLLGCG